MKQCHVLSLVSYELIKKSGFYAVNGIYHAAQKGKEAVEKNECILLPRNEHILLPSQGDDNSTISHSAVVVKQKKLRTGKGSNILSVVQQLLQEPEIWIKVESKSCYQFPEVYKTPCQQQLMMYHNLYSHVRIHILRGTFEGFLK